jgi:hypothetical protein
MNINPKGKRSNINSLCCNITNQLPPPELRIRKIRKRKIQKSQLHNQNQNSLDTEYIHTIGAGTRMNDICLKNMDRWGKRGRGRRGGRKYGGGW